MPLDTLIFTARYINPYIPHVFSLMNLHRVYELTDYAKSDYKQLLVPMDSRKEQWHKDLGMGIDQCVECGQCETKCPQKLSIMNQLKETDSAIG